MNLPHIPQGFHVLGGRRAASDATLASAHRTTIGTPISINFP